MFPQTNIPEPLLKFETLPLNSTLLTSPNSDKKNTFVEMHVCTKDVPVHYEFFNAYSTFSLLVDGDIPANSGLFYLNIENIKLDVKLMMDSTSGAKETIFI